MTTSHAYSPEVIVREALRHGDQGAYYILGIIGGEARSHSAWTEAQRLTFIGDLVDAFARATMRRPVHS